MPRTYNPTLQRFRSLWRVQRVASNVLNTCSARHEDRAQEAYLSAFWAAIDVGEAVLANTRDPKVVAEICSLVRNDPCAEYCELGDLAVDRLIQLTLPRSGIRQKRPALGARAYEARAG